VLTTREPFVKYAWSEGATGERMTVNNAGLYWVTVTDANGCTATDTVVVKSRDCLVGLYVPTAFTPDGNGKNDLLRPLSYGPIKLQYFAVFNRWGQQVFETRTPWTGWDGRLGAQPAPAGVYVWICQYEGADGKPAMQKGTAVLVR
jgi:gliding motility-associated-like protein